MKRRLITLATVCAVALTTISIAQAQDPSAKGPRWRDRPGKWGNPLEHMTKNLGLTPEQQAKIQPILDQAKPQVQAIHEDAKQKIKAIRDNARTQIRAVLTPEQQQKFDALQTAREDMRKAKEEMRAARKK